MIDAAAETSARPISNAEPTPIRAGFRTKRTGTRNSMKPRRMEVTEVFIGGDLAIVAAVIAEIATGGVMADRMPQYRM